MSKLTRRQIAQAAVRPELVVLLTPLGDLLTGVVYRQEPIHIETLVSQRSVEAFDDSVIWRGCHVLSIR